MDGDSSLQAVVSASQAAIRRLSHGSVANQNTQSVPTGAGGLLQATNSIFRRRSVTPQAKRKRKRGRQEREETKLTFFCLGHNNTRRVPNAELCMDLKRKGLGEKSLKLKRNMAAEEIEELMNGIFRGLPLQGFTLWKASQSKKLVGPLVYDNVGSLKRQVRKGKVFILPRRNILTNDESEQTNESDTEEAALEINSDLQNELENVLSSSAEQTTSNKNQDTDTEGESSSGEDFQEPLPTLSRPRRRAATVGLENIHRMCTNIMASDSFIESDSYPGSPLPSQGPRHTAAETVTSGSLDVISPAELRRIQDEEFQQSLIADQIKDREREQVLEQKRQEAQQIEKELERLQKIVADRKANLPAEPASGFTLKIRGGNCRKFSPGDTVQTLVNFVGSQESASEHFSLKIAGTRCSIFSWDPQGYLSDIGIVSPAVIEVQWNLDKTETTPVSRSHGATERRLYHELVDDEPIIIEDVSDSEQVQPRLSRDVRQLLQDYKIQNLDLDSEQKIVVSRWPQSLWEHSLRCFSRSSFNPKKLLKVEFRNEAGVDEGGLRREYFEMLLKQMLKSNLFEDTGEGFQVSNNYVALLDGQYQCAGKILATIILQGGPITPTFCHSLMQYGIMGLGAATLATVADCGQKDLITQIQNSDNLAALATSDEVLELMEKAGLHLQLTAGTSCIVAKALSIHCSVLTRRKAMLDDFWQGAEQLGFHTFLKENPEIESFFCKKCGLDTKLSADDFMGMVIVTCHGNNGSNARRISEEVSQNFESYVYDCEDGKCMYGDVKVEISDILKFVTGSSTVVPGGFDSKFTIHFTEERCYPFVSTCTFDLTLPLHLNNYRHFKEVMTESIISGPGFGRV